MLLANAGELGKYVHMFRAQTTATMKEIKSNCLIDTAKYPSKKERRWLLSKSKGKI